MKILKVTLTLLLAGLAGLLAAQSGPSILQAGNGKISFFSETPVENIQATNAEVGSVLDTKTGNLVFRAPIKKFMFANALMQEHFNENYMESNRFPNAEFTGTIQNHQAIDWAKPGIVSVTVKGKLTIHGVTHDIITPAKLDIHPGNVRAYTTLNVKVADYNIRIPNMVGNKISEIIRADIDVTYRKPVPAGR